ncbi:hypothetical protein ACMFMG_000712 [Clarireedia jacksonii]
MAVSVQGSFYPKSSHWDMADQRHQSFSAVPTYSSSSMAYPYQMPASGLESPGMMPGYSNHLTEPIRSTSPSAYGPGQLSSNRNLEASSLSKNSKDPKTKRSMSTPNIRGTANPDAAALALVNDKRRNKLGYHRTSVACGHCRRRKIRCIPAAGDPQNRCSNCIRLKKECNFYPVDQQPQPEPKRRGSKAQSGTGRASESSSPTMPPGQLPDMQSGHSYQHLNMPPIQDLAGTQMKSLRTDSFSPENKVVASSRNFEYNPGPTNWVASEVSPNTKTPADYWRVNSQESPITPAFSPYGASNMHIPNPQGWSGQGQQSQETRQPEWSAPQRSTSYSNLEGLQSSGQYTTYGLPPSATDQYAASRPRQQHPGMYPPPITTANAISAPEISSASSIATPHAQSAGAMSTGSFSGWNNQSYSYAKVPPVGSNVDTYNAWNPSHATHQQIPEEVQGGTAAGYGGYGDAGNAVYYAGQPQSGR